MKHLSMVYDQDRIVTLNNIREVSHWAYQLSKENLNPWSWSNWLQLGKLNQFGVVSFNLVIDEFFRGEGLTLSMPYT